MRLQCLLAAALTAAQFAPWHATICQSQPPLAIVAGSAVSARLACPSDGNTHCEAVLLFDDQNFLPYVVDLTGDLTCSAGNLCLAEFIVPPASPNGPATLFWLCAGQTAQMCVDAEISNGRGDVKSLQTTSSGTLLCLPDAQSASSSYTLTSPTGATPSKTISSGTSRPSPTKLEVIPIDRVRRHRGTSARG